MSKSINKINVAIDAMGGDYAPYEIVKGGLLAVKELGIKVTLVGKAVEIEEILHELDGSKPHPGIEIVNATGDIPMDEKNPARAVRRGQDSSVVIANKLVAEGKADAVVAAGHTGAATAASLFELKRISGFERPCICTLIPTIHSKMFLIDGGSNIETTPEQMVQSGIIGDILAKVVLNIDKPKIALLNVGEEEGKGNSVYQEAYQLLKKESDLNFVGNAEGKTIIDQYCDVAICDGFVGNIHLKALEGGLKMMSAAIHDQVKNSGAGALFGGMLLKSAGVFDRIKAHFHPNSYGGALLGGVNGISIISHGSSNAEAIKNACKHAKVLIDNQVLDSIKTHFS